MRAQFKRAFTCDDKQGDDQGKGKHGDAIKRSFTCDDKGKLGPALTAMTGMLRQGKLGDGVQGWLRQGARASSAMTR